MLKQKMSPSCLLYISMFRWTWEKFLRNRKEHFMQRHLCQLSAFSLIQSWSRQILIYIYIYLCTHEIEIQSSRNGWNRHKEPVMLGDKQGRERGENISLLKYLYNDIKHIYGSGLVTPLLPWITGELSHDSSSWHACSRSCCSWGSWYTLFIRSCWSLHLQRTRQWILLGRSGTVLAGGPYVPMSCKQQALGFSMALDPCWTARSSQAGNSWKGRKKLLVSRHIVPLWTWVHGGGHNTIRSSTSVALRRTEEVTIFLSWTSMRGQPIVGNKYGSWHQPEQHGCKLTSGFTERIGGGGWLTRRDFFDAFGHLANPRVSSIVWPLCKFTNFTATQPETRPTLLKLSISSQFILVTTLQGVGPQLWIFLAKWVATSACWLWSSTWSLWKSFLRVELPRFTRQGPSSVIR